MQLSGRKTPAVVSGERAYNTFRDEKRAVFFSLARSILLNNRHAGVLFIHAGHRSHPSAASRAITFDTSLTTLYTFLIRELD